ncbi:hypothetical protein FOA52_013476 [Chlamydomonas sp. UWO 241]|nr:hypothetical protein FOA52_013476 [Chlamydomonas sp. UWO 241]
MLSAAEALPERHWSSGMREPSLPALSPRETFDLVIAADCLYFADQEDPLVASLQLRMRRPHGAALIVFQPRNNNYACFVRLQSKLRAAGMHVLHEAGHWDIAHMTEEHLRSVPGHCGASQRAMDVARTENEQGDMEALTVAWVGFEGALGPDPEAP